MAQTLAPPEVAAGIEARVTELVADCDGLRAADRDDLAWDATREIADLLGGTGHRVLGDVHWLVSSVADGRLDGAQPGEIADAAAEVAVELLAVAS